MIRRINKLKLNKVFSFSGTFKNSQGWIGSENMIVIFQVFTLLTREVKAVHMLLPYLTGHRLSRNQPINFLSGNL